MKGGERMAEIIGKGTGKHGVKIFDEEGDLIQAESFVFYKTWLDMALKIIDEKERLEYLTAIITYGIYGKEPDENRSNLLDFVWEQIKFSIDRNNKSYIDGCKGGRPPKEDAEEEQGRFSKMYSNKT